MNNVELLDQAIDARQQEFRKQYGNKRDDYYGLVFMENMLQLSKEKAVTQIAFGNCDLGVDGFYFDEDQGTFRIFQFKNSKSARLFSESMASLHDKGIPALFADHVAVPDHQPIIDSARRFLEQNREKISQIIVDFVFRGDPQEAEHSAALSNLADRLKELSWMTERYFGDRVPLKTRFLPFDGLLPCYPTRDNFKIRFRDHVEFPGPDGVRMHLGLVPLVDLYGIHSVLRRKFLERNIRFALPPDGHVNRALSNTFSSILLEKSQPPALFALHHNGLTLSAGLLERKADDVVVHAPRLLNGAQTVSTFADFLDRNGPGLRTAESQQLIDELLVPIRIITNAKPEMITEITISNNCQNPVQAWQLHANDQIQLELEDWFRELGIPYQRQDRAFAKVTAEDWQMLDEYKETRAVELIRLARTYLAAEGELGKLTHIRQVFENRRDYEQLFGRHRLNADPRRIVLCYKVQYRLPHLAQEIREKGKLKYDFVNRTRDIIWALVCQCMLNDNNVEDFAEKFGGDLARPHAFNNQLGQFASTRVRFLLDDLINDKEYKDKAADGNYSFMRTPGAFKKAMKYANRNWGWKAVLLR